MKPDRGWWVAPLATLLVALLVIMGGIATWYGLRAPVDPWRASDVAFALSLLAYSAVGWLIAVRGPQNALGWIYLTFPVVLAIGAVDEEFTLRAAYVGSNDTAALLLIAGTWLAFLGYWLLNGASFLLFPDGRFPSDRFRRAFWGLAALMLIAGVLFTFDAGELCLQRIGAAGERCIRMLQNPVGLVSGAGLREWGNSLFSTGLLLTVGLSLAGVVVRYQRSAGDVRQQIKWVAWLAGVGGPVLVAFYLSQEVLGLIPPSDWDELPYLVVVSIGLPAAIGIAMLKYRLYEIDRLISRTAAYTLVALVLAAVYAGGVTLTQLFLPVRNQFGVVVSTLLAAALFSPLRRRVQDAVDRRFNRSRYDAQQVLDEFSARLREVMDLEQMQATLLSAAQETMQPSHLSLWVRRREPRPQSSGGRS